jgi:hypothetical protein
MIFYIPGNCWTSLERSSRGVGGGVIVGFCAENEYAYSDLRLFFLRSFDKIKEICNLNFITYLFPRIFAESTLPHQKSYPI